MRFLFVFLTLPVFCQVYLPHIADPNGSFSTVVTITNTADSSALITLNGFTAAGGSLGSTILSISAHGRKVLDPAVTFGASIGYIRMADAPDALAFATYQAESAGALPASVGHKAPSPIWHLLPGDWTLAWDGLAIVNVGDVATTVRVRQVNSSGATLSFHDLALGSGEKELLVLPSLFAPEADAHFEIEALQGENLVVTALRGNADSTILWENAALRNGVTTQTGDDPLARALGVWFFAFQIGNSSFDDTYAIADTGTSNGSPFAFGLDEFGDVVVVSYLEGLYVLYDPGSFLDRWYFYEIDAVGESAEGCYYQGQDGMITSDCFQASGGKVVVNSKDRSDAVEPLLPPGNPPEKVVAMGRQMHRAWLQAMEQ